MLLNLVNKISRKFIDKAYSAGVLSPDTDSARGLRIIVYHGIDTLGRKDINSRFISVKEFESQIKYFKENFNIISLDDCLSGRLNNDKLNICINFDDGYKNNLINALPVLEKYNVPASIFVTAIRSVGYDFLWADYLDLNALLCDNSIKIDNIVYKKIRGEYRNSAGVRLKQVTKNENWDFKKLLFDTFGDLNFRKDDNLKEYWELLNENEIRYLAHHPLITIGAHGVYHNNLDVSNQLASEELKNSKQWLENVTGKTIDSVAFPDGAVNPYCIQESFNLGYKILLCGNDEINHINPVNGVFSRITIDPFISLPYFVHFIVKGSLA